MFWDDLDEVGPLRTQATSRSPSLLGLIKQFTYMQIAPENT